MGLLGQQTAAAAAPEATQISMQTSSMSADCMEMMGKQPHPAEKPCKGLTLDCIAAMGCAIPLARLDAAAAVEQPVVTPVMFWTTTRVLIGADLAPEPEPPTILG
jgi:hypothetical protein